MKNRKILLPFFTFICLSFVGNAQLLSGSLVDEGRKMVTTSDFTFKDLNTGTIVYELAVNRLGKVTSAKLVPAGTTISSTPTRVKVRNHLMGWSFQEGTYFPEFHHVKVKITVVTE